MKNLVVGIVQMIIGISEFNTLSLIKVVNWTMKTRF